MVIVAASYGWFRWIDDIVDGDTEVPGAASVTEFLKARRKALHRCLNDEPCPAGPDVMLWYCRALSEHFGLSLRARAEMLLGLIELDYERRESRLTWSEIQLRNHAIAYDRSIIGTVAYQLGGNAIEFENRLTSTGLLGTFTLSDWLHDMPQDLPRGVVNIPDEAISHYGIKLNSLAECSNLDELLRQPGFREWFSQETAVLNERWDRLMPLLGHDFAGAFKPSFVARVFRFVIIHWFNRSALLRNPVDP